MKKGIFLENWELAAINDVFYTVVTEGYFELEKQEVEVCRKIVQHIEEVEKDWKQEQE